MNALTARGCPAVRAGLALTVLLGILAALGEGAAQTPPRSMVIEVLVADGGPSAHHPAAKAIVRLEGSEDALETNERGRAKVVGIASDSVMLQIMVAGADICRLIDVPVLGSHQVVSVLIDKAPQAKCRRLD